MPARAVVAEKHLRQGRTLVLRGVGHVQDRGNVFLRPVDGEGEAGDQDDNGPRIGGVRLLHELFLGKIDGFPIASFASVAGRGAGQCPATVDGVVPVVRHIRTAGGIVSDHDHRDVGGFGRVEGRVAQLILCVIHFYIRTELRFDSLQRRDCIRRRTAIPVPVHRVGERPDDSD